MPSLSLLLSHESCSMIWVPLLLPSVLLVEASASLWLGSKELCLPGDLQREVVLQGGELQVGSCREGVVLQGGELQGGVMLRYFERWRALSQGLKCFDPRMELNWSCSACPAV